MEYCFILILFMKNLSKLSDLVHTIVDKVQIAVVFVFNERIATSAFEIRHEYVCVCRDTCCSHNTAFDLKEKV